MLGDMAVASHLETTGSFKENGNRSYVTPSAHSLSKYMTVNNALIDRQKIDKRGFYV